MYAYSHIYIHASIYPSTLTLPTYLPTVGRRRRTVANSDTSRVGKMMMMMMMMMTGLEEASPR